MNEEERLLEAALAERYGAVEPKVEIRSYVYLRKVVEQMVTDVLAGLDSPPQVEPYNGEGPAFNPAPDVVVWIPVGDSDLRQGGKVRPELVNQGWDWIRNTKVEPEIAWLQQNPIFQNVAVLLHNPFGTWRKYMHLDQWDYACAAQYRNVVGDSWDAWVDAPYDVRAYIGAATTVYPGVYPFGSDSDWEGVPFTDTDMATLARIIHRNLLPYQRTNMGLVVDVMANMVVSEIDLTKNLGTAYRTQEAVAWYMMMEMFGNIGIEQLPKGKPAGHNKYFCEPVLRNDGYITEDSFRRQHGDLWPSLPQTTKDYYLAKGISPDISHIQGNIYRLASCGGGNIEKWTEDSRRIITDGHVPCLGYINVAINAGADPMDLTP